MTAPIGESAPAGAERQPGTAAWLLLSPLLAWLLLFVVAPTLILLAYSFFRGTGLGEVSFHFTLHNYGRAFAPAYARIFVRSLEYAGLTTALCILIGYPVAYFIGRTGPAWRNRLLLLVMIPFLTSFLIRAYAWFIILRDHGVLNGLLEALRIIPSFLGHRIELLYTPSAVVIGLVYTYLPFMILPIYGSVEKLDENLIEAAADLGAGPARSFLRVILPLTWPGVSAGVMLVFVPSIAMFAVTSIMGGAKIRLIGDEIQDQFLSAGDLPFGAALGILLLALFLLSFLLFPRRGASD
jgi:spermidine/putrescine transport system permease protein